MIHRRAAESAEIAERIRDLSMARSMVRDEPRDRFSVFSAYSASLR
jgi:hypothetical protein